MLHNPFAPGEIEAKPAPSSPFLHGRPSLCKGPVSTDVRQDLEVGLLSPTAAREIARLPAGNQSEVANITRREALSGEELRGVVRLLLESTTAEQKMFVLTKPREALGHASAPEQKGWDPRLSTSGNRLSKQLGPAQK